MSATKQQLEQELKELQTFMASSAFARFRAAREAEIKQDEDFILNFSIRSHADEIAIHEVRGARQVRLTFLQSFEEICVTLKALIDQKADSDIKNTAKP